MTQIDDKAKIEIDKLDIAIARLGAKTGHINNPIAVISREVTGMSQAAIRSRIKLRKGQKLFRTKGTNKNQTVTRLDLTDEFFLEVYGLIPTLDTNGNGYHPDPTAKVKMKAKGSKNILPTATQPQSDAVEKTLPLTKKAKPRWILVDYWNIRKAEEIERRMMSYSKLRAYAQENDNTVLFAEIHAPAQFQDPKFANEAAYFTKLRWDIFIVGDSIKDKDQVDARLSDRVRQILHFKEHVDAEVWIVSQDRDFSGVVEINKDRNQHNIRLIDPFKLPFLLGLTNEEEKLLARAEINEIVEIMEQLRPKYRPDESDEQKFIRYTMALLLHKPSNIISYNRHDDLLREIEKFLRQHLKGAIDQHPDFIQWLVTALKHTKIISQIRRGQGGCKFSINKKHHFFASISSPDFLEKVNFAATQTAKNEKTEEIAEAAIAT